MEELIIKYLEETATDAEKRDLLQWLREKENRKAFYFHRSVWEKVLESGRFPAGGAESWNRIQSGLLEKSCEGWQKSRKLTQLLRYAAIFFFLTTLGFSLLWYIQGSRPGPEAVTQIMADNGADPISGVAVAVAVGVMTFLIVLFGEVGHPGDSHPEALLCQ